MEIQTTAAGDLAAGTPAGQIAAGTATFESNGALTGINITGANVVGTSSPADTTLNVPWNPSLGVTSPQPLTLNLSSLTQLSSASTQGPTTTNGTTFGSLSSVAVDKAGMVNATFSNGTTRQIAQIAMATFPNEDGLLAVNGNAYQATAQSGGYALQTAGSGGAGTIASSSLEASTVDLSTEFTDLITTQSAYSAASKVITTADNMTQALLAIIQG